MSVPAKTSGSSGWARNVNDVTTPKLPPPPRRPQNRSGFSVALARTCSPVARTTSAATRLSIVRPCGAGQPADAAAERQAGDPGPGDDADRHRQPERLRRAIDVAEGGAGPDADETGVGIDLDRVEPPQVQDDPVVDGAVAGDVVAAAADRERQAGRACERDRRRDVGRARRPGRSGAVACRSSRSRPVAPRRSRRRRRSGRAPGSPRERVRTSLASRSLVSMVMLVSRPRSVHAAT